MSDFLFIRTSEILTVFQISLTLKPEKHNFPTIKEVRIFIEKDSDKAFLQTHSALKSASINASIEIHNELDFSLDITVAIKPFIKCIKNLGTPEFVKISYEESRLRVYAASFGGELLEEKSSYFVLERKPRQFINYQNTNLIVDYNKICISEADNFACRNKQQLVVSKLAKLAKTSKKKKDVQVKLEQVGNLILIHLFAEDCYLKLQFIESGIESEVAAFLDLAQLVFLELAMKKLIKANLVAYRWCSVNNLSSFFLVVVSFVSSKCHQDCSLLQNQQRNFTKNFGVKFPI